MLWTIFTDSHLILLAYFYAILYLAINNLEGSFIQAHGLIQIVIAKLVEKRNYVSLKHFNCLSTIQINDADPRVGKQGLMESTWKQSIQR